MTGASTSRTSPPGLFGDSRRKPPSQPERVGQATVEYVPARDILTRATGFMDAYDFTLNPYSGCSFGCTYCYAAFFSHSPEKRDSWGKWVAAKENAVELLRGRRPGRLDHKLIYMSSVTDPYQPLERRLRLTRGLLEIMARFHRPLLVVQTRSPDVTRDCDLFQEITRRGGRVHVNMTVTTDDDEIRRGFEPYCPGNPSRLRATAELRRQGIDVGVTMTPLLLVRDPDQFAADLLATGAKQFIVQPFHFKRGKFIAGTRDAALNLLSSALGTSRQDCHAAYLDHYRRARAVLRQKLDRLGEGKDGFRPPFSGLHR